MNVVLAALKVFKMTQYEPAVPEIIKLFADPTQEIKDGASDTLAGFGEKVESKMLDVFQNQSEDTSYSTAQKINLKRYSVYTLLKIDKFQTIIKSNNIEMIVYASEYYQKSGNNERLKNSKVLAALPDGLTGFELIMPFLEDFNPAHLPQGWVSLWELRPKASGTFVL